MCIFYKFCSINKSIRVAHFKIITHTNYYTTTNKLTRCVSPQAVWYNQVIELRTLAEKYKAKSHGSHFSPNNMVQLAYSSAQLRDKPPYISPSGFTYIFII